VSIHGVFFQPYFLFSDSCFLAPGMELTMVYLSSPVFLLDIYQDKTAVYLF
jgi:hypothetical protein